MILKAKAVSKSTGAEEVDRFFIVACGKDPVLLELCKENLD